jgi:DNA-binding response OmpR family regulator
MTGIDGYQTLHLLREHPATRATPCILMTGESSEIGMRKGMELGADDYLPKPFDLTILLARVRGLLRRSAWARTVDAGPSSSDAGAAANVQAASSSQSPNVIAFAGNTLDLDSLELRVGTMPYHLTAMEADLLQYLLKNAGKVVSRKAILEDVWNVHEDTDTRAIDNFIVRLRRFLNENPAKPRHVLTVRGIGYKFIAEPKPDQ